VRMLRGAGFRDTRLVFHRAPEGEERGRVAILASKVRGFLEEVAKVTRGKDGWLFLDNDTNEVLKQHAGEVRFSEGDLGQWQSTLESRVSRLAERRIPYFFLVAPNKESIYSDELPDDVVSVPERPIHQLLHHLERERSPATVIYPERELIEAKRRWPVYPKADTHWSAIGAFIAYRKLIDELSAVVPTTIVRLEDLIFLEWMTVGDLGEKLHPPVESTRLEARPKERNGRLLEDNGIRNVGRVLRFERPDLDACKCLLFGDSFAWGLLGFLMESFRDFVFVHRNTVDYGLVDAERPDVVIGQSVERFMISVPEDEGAPPTEEIVTRKQEHGEILGPEELAAFRVLFRPLPSDEEIEWSVELAERGLDLPL
jgi:hypothetical protein